MELSGAPFGDSKQRILARKGGTGGTGENEMNLRVERGVDFFFVYPRKVSTPSRS